MTTTTNQQNVGPFLQLMAQWIAEEDARRERDGIENEPAPVRLAPIRSRIAPAQVRVTPALVPVASVPQTRRPLWHAVVAHLAPAVAAAASLTVLL